MKDFFLFLILAVVVGSAGFYVYRAKKRGVRCIGCPNGSSCGSCQSKKQGAETGSCCGSDDHCSPS